MLSYNDYCIDPLYGVWRQKVLKVDMRYGDYYFSKDGRDSAAFLASAKKLGDLRAKFIKLNTPDDILSLLDVGCGLGSTVIAARDAGFVAEGHEPFEYHKSLVEPVNIEGVLSVHWGIVTFFDVLEHFPIIEDAISIIKRAKYVVISVPACHFPEDVNWFMTWKHRKPGEHLWHFNLNSLSGFMETVGFSYVTHGYPEDEIRGELSPKVPNILTAIYRRADA